MPTTQEIPKGYEDIVEEARLIKRNSGKFRKNNKMPDQQKIKSEFYKLPSVSLSSKEKDIRAALLKGEYVGPRIFNSVVWEAVKHRF